MRKFALASVLTFGLFVVTAISVFAGSTGPGI
jgi:hypothetical protein